MKLKQPAALLILILIIPLFLNYTLTVKAASAQPSPSLFFGVDVAYGGVAGTEQLIDNVSSYTNFFVIGCTNSYNLTTLTTISQYIYGKGMYFIVFSNDPRYPSSQWLQDAQTNYGSSFLGLYYFDEPGGRQLDEAGNITEDPVVPAAELNLANENYSNVANLYVNSLNYWLGTSPLAATSSFANPPNYQLFTSDYGLYWYDYEAGYNTVFAEFTMNYNQQLAIALCRGAATAQNKDWGIMITWASTQPPYMENSTALYNDMVLAYENDAKYIVIFDTNANYTQNVLTQPQLDAMKQFWQYTQANPRTTTPTSDKTAYVLPDAYGYGFRGPQDKMWGLWSNDSLTTDLCMSMSTLLKMDGNNLDIVYPSSTLESAGYKTIIEWNNTQLIPTPMTSPHQATSPFYATTVFLYTIAGSVIVAAAVAVSVFKFQRKTGKQPKAQFS